MLFFWWMNTLKSLFLDVDECSSLRLNTCDQICENTSPGYRCKCREGYRLSPDGRSCLDIDECSEGENAGLMVCPAGQRCLNKPGSFSCVQGCGEGLRPSATGDGCEGELKMFFKKHTETIIDCSNMYPDSYSTAAAGAAFYSTH